MKTLPKILIIDDEEIVRDTLESLLSIHEVELIFAADGETGISKAREFKPDAILLDVMMPVMNGFEVCRQIRAMSQLAEVPIIMITALHDRESRLEGLRVGVDDFLTKPFDSFELTARIQTILRLNRYRQLVEQRAELERAHQQLIISYDQTIEGWVHALDLRDRETEGHSQRVTQTTVEFAKRINIPQEKIEGIRRGALLHDVGKLGIPDAILLKPGKLTEEEWVVMRRHPVYAHEWLSSIEYLRPSLEIPYCHHEKWDGSGYPRQLRGDEIPLSARLFAIVDVWDALCSERPYHTPMPEDKVLDYIRNESGRHFDPALIEVFLKMRRPD